MPSQRELSKRLHKLSITTKFHRKVTPLQIIHDRTPPPKDCSDKRRYYAQHPDFFKAYQQQLREQEHLRGYALKPLWASGLTTDGLWHEALTAHSQTSNLKGRWRRI